MSAVLAPRDVSPLEPGCAWSGYAPPDLQHCEANLCGWITTPANTWSNLPYIVLGIWLYKRLSGEPGALRWFGPVSIVVGATSFIFHASFTAMFQAADYAGMFLLTGFLLALDLERLGWIEPRWAPRVIGAATTLSLAAFFGARALGLPVQWVMVVQALALAALQTWLWFRFRGADHRLWYAALVLLALSVACWLLDYTRVWCDPDNHWLQGHAAWHLLTAAAFACLAGFYRQFRPIAPTG